MKYIKITTTNNYSNKNNLTLHIEDKTHKNKIVLFLNLTYPLEIVNGLSDEVIISTYDNGLINKVYIKRKVFKEETSKEEIIKEYLDIPNIFLFKGINYIKTNCKNYKIEMENNNEYK